LEPLGPLSSSSWRSVGAEGACRPGFFLPVRVLSRLFRRLFLQGLEAMHAAGELQFFTDLATLKDAVGVTAVLHSWGQNLQHHPHVHCIVPGGGISPDGKREASAEPALASY
jgi:Putative transposase